MKKYCYSFLILLTLLIVSIMMLSACSISILSQATPPYDFAIYDRNNKTYLYSNPEGNAQAASLVDTLKREGEDYRFWGLPFSWEMDGSFFTKTTASAKDLKHLAIYDLVLKQLSRLDYPDESIEPFYIIFNDKDFSLAENKN